MKENPQILHLQRMLDHMDTQMMRGDITIEWYEHRAAQISKEIIEIQRKDEGK